MTTNVIGVAFQVGGQAAVSQQNACNSGEFLAGLERERLIVELKEHIRNSYDQSFRGVSCLKYEVQLLLKQPPQLGLAWLGRKIKWYVSLEIQSLAAHAIHVLQRHRTLLVFERHVR